LLGAERRSCFGCCSWGGRCEQERGIADDVLRDLFKRGKYSDVILPMCVIRRMDAVLEPSKQAVLDTKKMLDEARITEQRAALCDAAGQAFYNRLWCK
jgi:type I restriction enzyme M protein